VVQRQQFQWAHGVVLFSGGAGLVSLDLSHHTYGHFQPLGQAFE
jgi:hypothetical protein